MSADSSRVTTMITPYLSQFGTTERVTPGNCGHLASCREGCSLGPGHLMSRAVSSSAGLCAPAVPAFRAGGAEGAQHERRVEGGHDRLPSFVLTAAVQPAPLAGPFPRGTREHPPCPRRARVKPDPGPTPR